jgi:hypothetical protein
MADHFKRLKERYLASPIRLSSWTLPFALLATLILAFGLLVKDLGFYQDDWHHIYFGHTLGISRMWDVPVRWPASARFHMSSVLEY